MHKIERIKVYIDVVDGKTVCICKRNKKRCRKDCEEATVERDRYEGWRNSFHQDKYGKGGF